MAVYTDLLRKTVMALPENSEAARRLVYDRARQALDAHLDRTEPPPSEEERARIRSQMEAEIAEFEAVQARPAAPEPSSHYPAGPPTDMPDLDRILPRSGIEVDAARPARTYAPLVAGLVAVLGLAGAALAWMLLQPLDAPGGLAGQGAAIAVSEPAPIAEPLPFPAEDDVVSPDPLADAPIEQEVPSASEPEPPQEVVPEDLAPAAIPSVDMPPPAVDAPEPMQPPGAPTVVEDVPLPPIETAPPPAVEPQPETAPANGAMLFDMAASGTRPTMGRIEWNRTVDADGSDLIVGEASFAEADLGARIEIRRNEDVSLRASHLMQIAFEGAGDAKVGDLAGVLVKDRSLIAGTALAGAVAEVVDGVYLFALDATGPKDAIAKDSVLARARWMDLAISFEDGRLALISLPKDEDDIALFESVFASWR